jgi:hypothetical protein
MNEWTTGLTLRAEDGDEEISLRTICGVTTFQI